MQQKKIITQKKKRYFAVSRNISTDYLQFHGNCVFVWSDSYHHQLSRYFVRMQRLFVHYFENTLNVLSRSNWIYLKTFLVIFKAFFFPEKVILQEPKLSSLIWALINHVTTHYHPILQHYETIITSCYPLQNHCTNWEYVISHYQYFLPDLIGIPLSTTHYNLLWANYNWLLISMILLPPLLCYANPL